MTDFGPTKPDRFGRETEREVFIELGDSSKKPNVKRDNFPIPVLEVDENQLEDFKSRRPKIVNRVVSQSIPAGTVVSEGSAVDLFLAPGDTVPGSLFTDGHLAVRELPLAAVHETFIERNQEVISLLARRPDAVELTDEEQAFVARQAQRNQVPLRDEPGMTVFDLFRSWQIANTFSG